MYYCLFLFYVLCATEAVGLHHSAREPFQGRLSLKKIKESMANKLAHIEELTGSTVSNVVPPKTTIPPRLPKGSGVGASGKRVSDDSSRSFWGIFDMLFTS